MPTMDALVIHARMLAGDPGPEYDETLRAYFEDRARQEALPVERWGSWFAGEVAKSAAAHLLTLLEVRVTR